MIDPTDGLLDELAAAHEKARRAYWEALDYSEGVQVDAHVGPAGRAAMAAALAVVERDYELTFRPCSAERRGAGNICEIHGCVYPGDNPGVNCRSES